MGNYINRALLKDESVVYETRLHRIVYLLPVLVIVLGALLWRSMTVPGVMITALGIVIFVDRFVQRMTSEYAVTSKRVVAKKGFLARRTIELVLSKVESVDVRQGVLGRMLGYGRIVVVGTGGTRERFSMIANPIDFRRAVQNGQSSS